MSAPPVHPLFRSLHEAVQKLNTERVLTGRISICQVGIFQQLWHEMQVEDLLKRLHHRTKFTVGIDLLQMSFGQSKLIALARVLATEADVLLLDEPASGIDTQWVEAMLTLIESLRSQGRTICIVEHNLHVVGRLADHTYFMELGRITAQGTIEELTNAPRLAAAYFGTA